MTILSLRPVLFALLLPATLVLAQQKVDDTKAVDVAKKPVATAPKSHFATGTVKKIDAKTGSVTLAHDAVKSLNWPAMTMGFKVKDMKLLDQFAEGKTVQVELVKVGNDYLINAVK